MNSSPQPHEARDLLNRANAARLTAISPRLTAGRSALCAAVIGIGIAAMGQLPGDGPRHLLAIAIGLALIAAGGALYLRYRAQTGLHGFDASGKQELSTFAIMGLVLAIGSFGGAEANAIIYPIIGAIGAIAWFVVFRCQRGGARA